MSTVQEKLQKYITASGGAIWQQIDTISADISGGGLMLLFKLRKPFYFNLHTIFKKRQNKIEVMLRKDGSKIGVFDNHQSLIYKNGIETEVKKHTDINRRIKGIGWTDADQMYFRGYAFLNYFSTPFFFTQEGFLVQQMEDWQEGNEIWERIKVIFPVHIVTHSKEQTFYFDKNGFLKRLDYTAEVFGKFATVAQYCYGHLNADGYIIPARRRMYKVRKNNKPVRFPMIWLNYKNVKLTYTDNI